MILPEMKRCALWRPVMFIISFCLSTLLFELHCKLTECISWCTCCSLCLANSLKKPQGQYLWKAVGINCELLVLVCSMSAQSWQTKPMGDCTSVKREGKCLIRLAGQGKMRSESRLQPQICAWAISVTRRIILRMGHKYSICVLRALTGKTNKPFEIKLALREFGFYHWILFHSCHIREYTQQYIIIINFTQII